MDPNEVGPPPDISEDARRKRVLTRWLPLASVVGAFGVVAAAVLRPGGDPPVASSAGSPGAAPRLPPPEPVSGAAAPVRARRGGGSTGHARGVPAIAVGARDRTARRGLRARGRRGPRVRGGRTARAHMEGAGEGVLSWRGRRRPRRSSGLPVASTCTATPGSTSAGSRQARRDTPADVTAIRLIGDEVLVADAAARVIRRYDLRGTEQGVIGAANKTGGFMLPNRSLDFDVDASGVVHATDTGRHRVTSWTLDGTMVASFGKFGMARPEDFVGCCNPVNVAVAPDGSIVTAEKVVARVKVFGNGPHAAGRHRTRTLRPDVPAHPRRGRLHRADRHGGSRAPDDCRLRTVMSEPSTRRQFIDRTCRVGRPDGARRRRRAAGAADLGARGLPGRSVEVHGVRPVPHVVRAEPLGREGGQRVLQVRLLHALPGLHGRRRARRTRRACRRARSARRTRSSGAWWGARIRTTRTTTTTSTRSTKPGARAAGSASRPASRRPATARCASRSATTGASTCNECSILIACPEAAIVRVLTPGLSPVPAEGEHRDV